MAISLYMFHYEAAHLVSPCARKDRDPKMSNVQMETLTFKRAIPLQFTGAVWTDKHWGKMANRELFILIT